MSGLPVKPAKKSETELDRNVSKMLRYSLAHERQKGRKMKRKIFSEISLPTRTVITTNRRIEHRNRSAALPVDCQAKRLDKRHTRERAAIPECSTAKLEQGDMAKA